jgi:hypothetical protein
VCSLCSDLVVWVEHTVGAVKAPRYCCRAHSRWRPPQLLCGWSPRNRCGAIKAYYCLNRALIEPEKGGAPRSCCGLGSCRRLFSCAAPRVAWQRHTHSHTHSLSHTQTHTHTHTHTTHAHTHTHTHHTLMSRIRCCESLFMRSNTFGWSVSA